MGRQRFPKMGKVALAVLEAKIEGVIGKDAIKEIKTPVLQKELHEALIKALNHAEKRLIDGLPSNDIVDALKQLPVSSLEKLNVCLWDYFENPLSDKLYDAIYEQLELIIPASVDKKRLAEVMKNYFQYFREEAVLIPEVAKKLVPVAIVKTESHSARTADAVEQLVKLEEAKKIDSLPVSYDNYLKFLVTDLSEWQTRYAPMFAKFKDLTLFARVTRRENRYNPQELINLVRRNDKLVIIGPAGSGKTTTLKKVALDNASSYLKKEPDSRIPIIVPLRDYGAEGIRSIIESVIKPWKLTLEIIEQDLFEGKFIIVFDGLNEVPSNIRQKCLQEIRNFTREYRENRFLFTSRNFEYEDSWVSIDENPVPVCEIESLTQGQIESYISKYFEGMKNLAGKLIYELKLHDSRVWENSKSLARLAGTPLLLQMLILTFEEMGRIPKTEGELLLRFVDKILFKRERSKSAGDFDPDVKKFLLASIAWEMQQDELSSIEKRRIYPLFLKKLDELKRDGRANMSTSQF